MKVDNAVSLQSPRRSPTDIPDVCKRPMVPHSFPKGFFIKISYMVRLMLRLHIQRYLRQKHVCPYATRGANTKPLLNSILEHFRQLPWCLLVHHNVRRKINKALINGVNVNVLSAQKIKIMAVDGAGVFLERKFNIANLSTHTKKTAAAVQSYTYSKLKLQRLCDAIPYSLQAQRICEYYFCHY